MDIQDIQNIKDDLPEVPTPTPMKLEVSCRKMDSSENNVIKKNVIGLDGNDLLQREVSYRMTIWINSTKYIY